MPWRKYRREDDREDGIGEGKCEGEMREPFLEYIAGR